MKKNEDDPYWEVVQEQHENILSLYEHFATNRLGMLFDIQEQRIYAYPYKEFSADLSQKSQLSLRRQYRAASKNGGMVVFVRDNAKRKLVSYSVPIN